MKLWNVTGDQIIGEISMPAGYKRIAAIKCNAPSNMFAVSSGQENSKRGGTLTLWDFTKLQTLV